MKFLATLLVACTLSSGVKAAARFAVVAGNNRGAQGRPLLWFAERDAERFAHALQELGDFAPDQVVLLRGASPGELQAALEFVEARIAAARANGEHALLVVYFSGHAGGAGLELGEGRLSYDDLRSALARSGADTRVGIVDACEAGELTQVKGARADPAIRFTVPQEEPARGTALIASTAVGEAAQESAAIGGSFFTHHLEIALRGAGDYDGDGRVTLAEAFRYTAARTVAGTASTRAGPQHPTYDFRMSGRGDVVLAELRRGEGSVRFPGDADAQYIIRGPRELFAEVSGSPAGTTLALPAGPYVVERRGSDGLATTEFVLARGETRELPPLRRSQYAVARGKGGPPPVVWFAGGGLASFPMPGLGVAPQIRAGARREIGPLALRLRAGYLRQSGVQGSLRYGFQVIDGGLAALWEVTADPLLLEIGPELSVGAALQNVDGQGSHAVGQFATSAVALASIRAGAMRLGLELSAGAHVFKLDGASVVRPGGALSLVVLYAP